MTYLTRVFVPTASKRLNELIGLLMLVCAVLLLLALTSYSPLDRSLDTAAIPDGSRTHNWIGLVGSYSSDLVLQSLGVMAFLLPVMVFLLSLRWMRSHAVETPLIKALGAGALVLFGGALLALLPWPLRWAHAIPIEGLVGRVLGDLMVRYLNYLGAWIVGLTALATALYLATAFSLIGLRQYLRTRFSFFFALGDRWQEWKIRRARAREERALLKKQKLQEKEAAKAAKLAAREEARKVKDEPRVVSPQVMEEGAAEEEGDSPLLRARIQGEPDAEPLAADPFAAAPAAREPQPAPRAATRPSRDISGLARMQVEPSAAAEGIAIGQRADSDRGRDRTTLPKQQGSWKLPSSTLLNRPEARMAYDEQELKELAQVLTQKCEEFNVMGSVVQINPGPVVTTFEFKPEAGIKYSRIVNLQDDLCLALRAESILIERMAGKSTVGIQVPNARRETIYLREVIENQEFAASKSRLTVALGKDINGRLMVTELNNMPHLLIAGSTGSGKSVAINAFIMSLLYKSTPDQVRLILVDPKRVELTNYDGVPHLFTPIISEPKLASNALRNAVREMERRLKLLAQHGVRNIDQYNKLFEEGYTPSLFEDGSEEKPLPFIVIIVDELADLMMVDGQNVEESITRLAQMARAIGIHLVLATQRPSVDVITGLIKANFPARMSFRVATKIDSRTILDANGAESLLGRGDMLYLPSGSSRVLRVHAPFVTEKEIAATVEFWKSQATAEYEHGFLAAPAGDSNGGSEDGSLGSGEDDNDPMYNDAVRLVFEFGKASTSLLQRRLRVGYGRAAHLIDLMERDGIVGPADGPKPREILKAPGWLDEVEETQ
ncbi:MAG: DNA translocase FtsK [Acidobacteriota bacterium]|nr:DNA translocase FtsK [Acidobacteriota bacterium]